MLTAEQRERVRFDLVTELKPSLPGLSMNKLGAIVDQALAGVSRAARAKPEHAE